MFCSAYTDCYILYRVRQYLIAFLGIFIFVGCVAVGAVFADLCNKKETARKNPTVSRRFYCTGDIIRIIPISCKKAAVSQSDSPTQRPFRFWLRLTASVHRRPCVPDGHRLHDAAAVGDTVAGFFVHMKAGQAVGAMVAVVAPGILRGADPPADFAGKGIVAGVGLIVTFFKGLTFVFTIHGNILLKICVRSSSGGVACGICQTSRSAHKSQCKCCMFQKVLLTK